MNWEIKPSFEAALKAGSSQSGGSLVIVALVWNVGLGVRAWETWGSAEVALSLSVLWSSKEESIGSYYNILIRIEVEKKNPYQ